VRDIKLVTVVDDDVDPFSPREVEWAMATRFQADRDVIIIPGANGNALDHSCQARAVTAKMGIDATYPFGEDANYEIIRVPGADTIDPAYYD
jgi:2,5-furandicarboxylate decarboxylase 1